MYIITYSAILVTACFLFYRFLLQRETFYKLNRWYLTICLLLSFTVPFIPLPKSFSLGNGGEYISSMLKVTESESKLVSAVKQSDTQGAASQKAVVQSVGEASSSITGTYNLAFLLKCLFYLYIFGVIVFALKFLIQVTMLLYHSYSAKAIKDGRYRIVEINEDKAPCSFGNTIFINPEKYDFATYNQILMHEKIHINQKHTLDILLAEIALAIQWFNPFAWRYRKALEDNLEYLTDETILNTGDVEKKNYQLNLVRVSVPNYPLSITNNYNQSLIKKRITMMNSKKSSFHSTWKYFFVIPVFVFLILFLNKTEIKAQNSVSQNVNQNNANNMNQTNYNDAVKQVAEGNWEAGVNGNMVTFTFFDGKKETSKWQVTMACSVDELQVDAASNGFVLTRDAGKIIFKGSFSEPAASGSYSFIASSDFKDYIKGFGLDNIPDASLFYCVTTNINRNYMEYLKENGVHTVEPDFFKALGAQGVVIDELREYTDIIKQSGKSTVSLNLIMGMRNMGVNKKYVAELAAAGYSNLSPENYLALKTTGIDKAFIDSLNKSGDKNLSVELLISRKTIQYRN
jgi:beta-lactamase regulating signal transducer with metallopeptidase domain